VVSDFSVTDYTIVEWSQIILWDYSHSVHNFSVGLYQSGTSQFWVYCKTPYFRCILISRFWNIDISLHFNLAFSQFSSNIYQAFDEQTEFSRVYNFAILSHSRNSRKFDARKKYMFYRKSVEFRKETDSLNWILIKLLWSVHLAAEVFRGRLNNTFWTGYSCGWRWKWNI